jgi:hypothetical protein
MLAVAKSLKNSERCVSTVGSTPCPSAKLVIKASLYRFSLVFARFVPVRRLAFWTNPWFAHRADSGHPLMVAATAFVPFLLDRNQSHAGNILDKDILSRETFFK